MFLRILILQTFIISILNSQSFQDIWFEMQFKYKNLKKQVLDSEYKKCLTDHWKNSSVEIDKLLLGPPDKTFLNNYHVGQNMVRGDFSLSQKFEECYLDNCLDNKTKKIIENFKDNDNNLLPKPSKYNLSVNTLGHLFYATKVAQNFIKIPKTIVEFGGGYGNLANVFKQIYQDTTIVIFDIPESIALQYLFLKYTNPDQKIVIQTEPLINLDKGTIYLVSVNLLNECKFSANIFISTFAITESSQYIQNLVVEKKFFSSDLIYVVGQINGWKESGHTWMTDHKKLINNIRENYINVDCQPYHHFQENLMSYEIIGKNN